MRRKCLPFFISKVLTEMLTIMIIETVGKMIYHTQLEQSIFEKISKVLMDNQYEVVRIRAVKMRNRYNLQIMVDKISDTITVGDCQNVSKIVKTLLKDDASYDYMLEVGSPGLNRPLTKEEDFSKYVGSYVRCNTKFPVDGRKKFSGVLQSISDRVVVITDGDVKEAKSGGESDGEFKISFDSLVEAHIDYFKTEELGRLGK